MNYTQADITIQDAPASQTRTGSAIRKALRHDPGLILQLLLVIPVVTGGILFNLNVIQWVLVGLVTMIYLVACLMRTAAVLQIHHDSSLTLFQISRIKSMGNAIVTITAALSLITYMLVFVPVIIELI
ncbi:MAG: diacylglycerol kinase [Bacteroidetes bacterium]|nr:diacylglycerol kinase [Bacteroidota bacterium]